jgi:hypothetical protein
MHLETEARARAPASLPLQVVHIELTPLIGGQLSISMQATLLDEDELAFIGQDLAHEHVDTLDQALAVIRQNALLLDVSGPR